MEDAQRVVVTGMGAVTPLGLDVETLWQNMLAGTSAIAALKAFDTTDYKVKNGAEVDSDLLREMCKKRKWRPLDRSVDMAILASDQALSSAGVIDDGVATERTNAGVIFGTGLGSEHSLYDAFMGFFGKGIRGVRPTSVPRSMANSVSAQISMRYQLEGPNYVIICACTSATTAIGTAYRMIKDGYIDMVLCGGTDATFDPFAYAAWNNLGVMSTNNDPAAAARPFDVNRDGCILGEGAAALVLESHTSALKRGRDIQAEIIGFGESSDAQHITRPNPDGQVKAIANALASAGKVPEDIGFVNAHGTATRANDSCESASIRTALGSAADHIPVASNKSFFGHLLGASGAVESVATILGLQHGKVPPNLNLETPDPECDLCFVGPEAMELPATIAMKNSFGFGGNNGVLILQQYQA